MTVVQIRRRRHASLPIGGVDGKASAPNTHGLTAADGFFCSSNRFRYGKNGDTSNGLSSAGEAGGGNLFFCISIRSDQGSTLIRVPSGKAATWSGFFDLSDLGEFARARIPRR